MQTTMESDCDRLKSMDRAFSDCVRTPREGEKLQVPPLRYASVGMTRGCLLIPMNCSSLFQPLPPDLSSREAVTFFIPALRPVPQGRAEFSPGRSPGKATKDE
jgi:hypothetical protein